MSSHIPQDEDDIPAVPLWRQPKMLAIGGAVAVVLTFIFTRGHDDTKKEETSKSQQAYIGDVVPYTPAPEPKSPAAKVDVPAAPVAFPPLPSPPAFRPTATPPKPIRPAMLSYAAPPSNPAAAAAAGGSGGRSPEAAETKVVFKGSDIPGTKASAGIDDTLMLMPGLLPCVLDTAISSDVPAGPLLCHLPGPVYSPKGVLLMEAETQVIGQYQGSKAGDGTSGNRLQASSAVAHTPNGIWVPLVGPMADDLGRSGLDGSVNHRYIERFSGAVLLTLTQGVLSIIQADVSKGGNTYLDISSGGGVGGLAQQILQSTINLPPIFSKHQGETIAIWITSPIDFTSSYKLRTNADAQR